MVLREASPVTDLDQEAVLAMLDEVRHRADPGRHDREPVVKRLDERDAERLAAGRQAEHVGVLVVTCGSGRRGRCPSTRQPGA